MDDDQLAPCGMGWLALRTFGNVLSKNGCPASMISGHGAQTRACAARALRRPARHGPVPCRAGRRQRDDQGPSLRDVPTSA